MKKLSVFLTMVLLVSMFGIVGAIPAQAAETDALNGKTALFVGDSIMTGWWDGDSYANGRGWGIRMRDNYGMTVNIAASAGQAMSTVRDNYMNPIYKQLENNKNNSYDYVILEGGFNDIMGNEKSDAKETAPLGTMSTSYDIEDFDRSTFASGLEHLLCYATTTFPNAKIGFIVTFETPYSKRGNGTNDRETTKQYFDLAKQICDKWNVPYLDLYDGEAADGTKYFDVFYPEGRTLVSSYPNGITGMNVLQRIKDDIHPNAAGYDASYAYIAAWMATLPTYTAPNATDVLDGKTAMFAGDSITYGYGEALQSLSVRAWGKRIAENYGMTVTNRGQNGHSLSDVRDYTEYGNADKRLHTKCFDTASYDYVILQGGVNDIIGAEPNKGHPNPGVAVAVGSIADTKDPDDFDTTTFAGGLERYFYEATTRYPTARIGFIITYQTPNSTWGGNTLAADAYWAIAREICDKWEIPYLDLYDDSYSVDILKANTDTYLVDTLHLNADGYDVITPYIAAWMATLPTYSTEQPEPEPEPTVPTPTVLGTAYYYDFNTVYMHANGTEYYSVNEDNETDYNSCIRTDLGVDTRLVSGGYDGALYAMQMAYTINRTTMDQQHYTCFSLPNTYDVKKAGRNPGQSIHLEVGAAFRITVRYKVTGYVSAAALYVGVGSYALTSGAPTFSSMNAAKITDITAATAGWQTASVYYAPTTDQNLYILLKMADDSNRAGTALQIGTIDIQPLCVTHTYTSDCDLVCDECNAPRGAAADHTYDDDCDTDCNLCGDVREIEHTYDDDCDADCNICGATRDADHIYSGSCDASCNICGDPRDTNADHTYDGGSDADCNICGAVREVKSGWTKEGGKWAYYKNGEKIKSDWMKDSVGWCYLGKDGYMLTNDWVRDSVGWCYVGSDGYCVTNCWQKDSVGWCYLDSNGRMATNQWVKDSVGWCYVGSDGYCITSAWQKDSVGWCYLDSNGRMATNQWIKDSVGWCYVGSDGYCLTNTWQKDSVGWCYLDASGRMVTNAWVKDSKGLCYLDKNGYWDGKYK